MQQYHQRINDGKLLKATNMLVDFTGNSSTPIINNREPLFSWAVNGAGPNAFQCACRILVAKEPDDNSIVWDSGMINRDTSRLRYSGYTLAAETAYFWKLQLRDITGKSSGFTGWHMFRTGTFNPSDNRKFSQLMVQENRVHPKILRKNGADSYFIDFGKDAYAGLELTLFANKPGEVELHLGEALTPENSILKPEPHSNQCGRRFRKMILELQPGRKTYRVEIPKPFMSDGYQTKHYNNREKFCILCPEHTGELMPFRYLEIKGHKHELNSIDIVQLAANFPFDNNESDFSSSEPGLDAVWDFCKYTIKATTPFTVYIDGDRERLPYAGDTYINQLSHYCCDREYSLTRNTLDYFFQVGTDWPFEAVMSIILIAHSDYLYTGDISICEKYYEKLKALLFSELTRNDGLLVTGKVTDEHEVFKRIRTRLEFFNDLVDWPKVLRGDYEIGRVNTVANSFLFRALNTLAEIALALDKCDDHAEFMERATKLGNSIKTKLFNPATGLFLDSEGSTHSSPHANFHAVAAGLAKPHEFPKIVELLKGCGMPCGLWGAQFLLEALFQAGAEDHALKLMTSNGPRSWLNMLRQGATMTMECWSNELQPEQDWNHAWSTAPLNIIGRFLMGIRPLEPGFRKILIQPRPGFLKKASLRLPTVNGTVFTSFRQSDSCLELELEIPGNCSATVILPDKVQGRKVEKLLVNSLKNEIFSTVGNIRIDNLCPGTHKLALHMEPDKIIAMESIR